MVVRELVVALLKCRDQEAEVFYGEVMVTTCDEIMWTEGDKQLIGREVKNRVMLGGEINYEEGAGYGQVA
jgi:hypothetical protein